MEQQTDGRTDGRTNGQTDRRMKVPLCSTGLRPLWGRCPKSENYSILFKKSWHKLMLKKLLEGSSLGQKKKKNAGANQVAIFTWQNKLWSEIFGWLRMKQKQRKRWMQSGGKMRRKESCYQKSNYLIQIAPYLMRIWPWKRTFAANLVLHLQWHLVNSQKLTWSCWVKGWLNCFNGICLLPRSYTICMMALPQSSLWPDT